MAETTPKKSWIPYYFVAFFAVVVLMNGIMIFISQISWTGLETKNHYIKGLSYNENLKGADQMAALGWNVNLQLTQISGLTVKFNVNLQDQAGDVLKGAEVQLTAIRPTHHGYDQKVNLIEIQPGKFEGQTTLSLGGQWDFKYQIVKEGKDYQETERFIVTEEGIQ